ncbi:MAG TPA: protoglobin domain-containing protein [Dehalococcoidia bacterium]|nr:protoglobin domain-containing protein [Dehalococcoidia bacterium]
MNPVTTPAPDAAGRLALAVRVAGFSDADAALVRATAAPVAAVREAAAAAVYEHLLSIPETARWFLRPDGSPDERALGERRRTLADWLALVASADLSEETARALVRIGRVHATSTATPAGPIPAALLVATIAFTQAAVADVLRGALGPERVLDASIAWNKLLMLHLDLMLAGYAAP